MFQYIIKKINYSNLVKIILAQNITFDILPSALLFTVHTAFGLPGNSDTAISETSSPCLKTLNVDLDPRPQAMYNCGVSSAAKIKKLNFRIVKLSNPFYILLKCVPIINIIFKNI